MSDKKAIIFMQSYGSMNTKLLLDNSTKNFQNLEIVTLPNETKVDVSSYDIIGFASGIYFWDLGKEIYNHINKLQGLEGKNAFVICTAGSPSDGYPKKPKEAIEKKVGNLLLDLLLQEVLKEVLRDLLGICLICKLGLIKMILSNVRNLLKTH